MKTSITISLLPSSPKMPFVLGPDLGTAIAQARDLGFDAFELFPPSLEAIDEAQVDQLSQRHGLPLSTIGTGGGAVAQGLTLTDANLQRRDLAIKYAYGVIERAGDLGAAAIIGSMQGRIGEQPRAPFMEQLGEVLVELGEHAAKWNQPVFFEPLNRYESDVVNTLDQTAEFLSRCDATNVKILADLFHMNIEEVSIAESLQRASQAIGHLHFVDSNRWVAGRGHTDFEPIAKTLVGIDYAGHLAVEAFPLPDQLTAARVAMDAFKRFGLC